MQIPTPAQSLLGKRLDDDWVVVEMINKSPHQTGGWFSQGYIVESPRLGRAYLKALDFVDALRSPDPPTALHAMTAAYNYERSICLRCNDRKLDKVVRAIGHGRILVDPDKPESVAQYLVFELAKGDVRTQLEAITEFDIAWMLRSLHHIATGLNQLHTNGIAHQDLKPSNVLVFDEGVSKIGDLGRSVCRDQIAPHDDLRFAGDAGYAPPELLYGHIDPNWNVRRQGCDAYLLGSMVVFFLARASMTALLLATIDESHHWQRWTGNYDCPGSP